MFTAELPLTTRSVSFLFFILLLLPLVSSLCLRRDGNGGDQVDFPSCKSSQHQRKHAASKGKGRSLLAQRLVQPGRMACPAVSTGYLISSLAAQTVLFFHNFNSLSLCLGIKRTCRARRNGRLLQTPARLFAGAAANPTGDCSLAVCWSIRV